MSFESHLNDHLKTLQQKRSALTAKLHDMIHSCDCEYCEYDGVQDGMEDAYEAVQEEIHELDKDVERIKRHAKAYNITIA